MAAAYCDVRVSASRPLWLSCIRRLHLPSTVVVVISKNEEEKDKYLLLLTLILILAQARRLFISPRPHGLIVELLSKQMP